MSFNSIEFILFLTTAVILYYVLPHKARNPLLLAASYIFYAFYSIPLVLFLILCTGITYAIALKIQSEETPEKKRWVKTGVLLSIGALAFYKYLNFVFSSINDVLKSANVEEIMPKISLVAPLGISFIIFQTVSYLVDVYRGTIPAERNLFRFALYVSFFPKVVQGPITKYGDLQPQFDEEHHFDWTVFRTGALMTLYGLFMKMVIADRAAVAVNTAYAYPGEYSGAALTLATILFALQIYFDFAGYSLTAIGVAKMLGFTLQDNFRQPYLSSSVGEFWRRWHISLNKWLTEYVYIPLGGSRCDPLRRDANTLVTFGLSGLWHGANWGYVIWGLLNGVYIVGEKRIGESRKKRFEQEGIPYTAKKHPVLDSVVTFVLVAFSWIFFRAQTLSASFTVVRQILFNFNLSGFLQWATSKLSQDKGVLLGLTKDSWLILLLFLAIAFIVDLLAQKGRLAEKVANASLPIRWTVFLVLIFAVIIFGMYGYGYSAGAFIYAQF